MSGIKPPKSLIVNRDNDMANEWQEWIQLYENYVIANKIDKEAPKIQTANFLAALGRQGLKVLNTLQLTEDEMKDLETIKKNIKDHFAPIKYKTHERYKFHKIKQREGENFDDFLQKLTIQIKNCSYSTLEDELIVDQIIYGICDDETRKKLMTLEKLTRDEAVKVCRIAEQTKFQMSVMGADQTQSVVNTIKIYNCKRCDTKHAPMKCPAFKQNCENCCLPGHYARKCWSKTKDEKNKMTKNCTKK